MYKYTKHIHMYGQIKLHMNSDHTVTETKEHTS